MSAAAPDIAGLLASLGGGASPPGMGGPSDVGGSQDAAQGEAQIPDLIQQAIDLIHQVFAMETDPIDKEQIAKWLAMGQSILSQEQKEKDQAMGGPGVRMIRRNR